MRRLRLLPARPLLSARPGTTHRRPTRRPGNRPLDRRSGLRAGQPHRRDRRIRPVAEQMRHRLADLGSDERAEVEQASRLLRRARAGRRLPLTVTPQPPRPDDYHDGPHRGTQSRPSQGQQRQTPTRPADSEGHGDRRTTHHRRRGRHRRGRVHLAHLRRRHPRTPRRSPSPSAPGRGRRPPLAVDSRTGEQPVTAAGFAPTSPSLDTRSAGYDQISTNSGDDCGCNSEPRSNNQTGPNSSHGSPR